MVRLLSILAAMCGLVGCVDRADEASTGVRVDIVVGVTSGTRADGVSFDMGSFGGTPVAGTPGGTPVAGIPVAGEPGTGATEGGFPPPIGDSEFRFVRITDLSNDDTSEDVGSDIDAVGVLDAATGQTQWAVTVEGTAGNIQGDPTLALGAPTAFPGWMSGDLTTCGVDAFIDGFVSMGRDGSISLGFANAFLSGDTIMVYEVGNCFFGGGQAVGEPVQIDVAVTGDIATASWVNLTTVGESPLITATVF